LATVSRWAPVPAAVSSFGHFQVAGVAKYTGRGPFPGFQLGAVSKFISNLPAFPTWRRFQLRRRFQVRFQVGTVSNFAGSGARFQLGAVSRFISNFAGVSSFAAFPEVSDPAGFRLRFRCAGGGRFRFRRFRSVSDAAGNGAVPAPRARRMLPAKSGDLHLRRAPPRTAYI
jgi:hypothetical protein